MKEISSQSPGLIKTYNIFELSNYEDLGVPASCATVRTLSTSEIPAVWNHFRVPSGGSDG